MNNGTSLQSEMLDGNGTHVTTFSSNSTPLSTFIDSSSPEGSANQISSTFASTIAEGLVNGVSEAISDAIDTVASSFSGNDSSSLQSLSAANTDSVPIIHNGTNNCTTENPFQGISEELCYMLNIFIFLLPFLSLLIVVPIAAALYDHTPLGQCYNKMCDYLWCTPEEDEHVNEDANGVHNDIEKGASAGGTRRKNSNSRDIKKNKKKRKKLRKTRGAYSFHNPAYTEENVQPFDFTYCAHGIGDIFFIPTSHETYFNTLTEVEGEKDDNGNGNKGTRTRGRKQEENVLVEGMGHVNIAFYSASIQSSTQENEEDHL
ncbi:unnamed protein product [Plasmodium vivax]|uniref:(malaria parasite P. vivax) hypothetical protein n=1 Tax=Plasmodium vivax TaxID=5855 RepID=A0A8S4HJ12_PLAVI|nr:unnamed protein product [Plasmodium vivax]